MAGKKNPKSMANLKPFQPGQSGNPAGAPKGKRWRTIIKEIMEQEAVINAEDRDAMAIQLLSEKLGTKFTNRHLVVFRQMIAASLGSTPAFRALADREEGRPAPENEDQVQGASYLDFLDSIAEGDE